MTGPIRRLIERGATYEITAIGDVEAFKCFFCGRISELRDEILNVYCGRCNLSHKSVAEARRQVRMDGATHECEEWRTAKNLCAVCDTPLTDRRLDEDSPSDNRPQPTSVLIKRLRRVAKALDVVASTYVGNAPAVVATWRARANICLQAAGRLEDLEKKGTNG